MSEKEKRRVRISIKGVVQGVGFRPFIYRLAKELGLTGWVNNSSKGVTIEAEGATERLENFIFRVRKETPQHSFIQSLQYIFLDVVGFPDFTIRESNLSEEKTTLILPDIATCEECQKEIFNPQDRRYLYPFTNCTHCGPRYSIIEALPYDRCHTSMKIFRMCQACQKEYEDPLTRRFHAQPNACPQCGPHLELWDEKGNVLEVKHQALLQAVGAIREGKIIALKGLGGFHLLADASNEKSVKILRERKNREEKPFALMFADLESVESQGIVSEQERYLLTSRESPIVLLLKKNKQGCPSMLASSVAPSNPYLGVMLPYTPLHHILMNELKQPVIATSANISDEPICIDEMDALQKLKSIADLFLIHNRGIVRHVDDSIVRIMMDRPMVLRRARGYAPLPVSIKEECPSVLSVGAHLKNTVALSIENNVFISQHIGDLETSESFMAFQNTLQSLKKLYAPSLKSLACDMHPQYLSTQHALEGCAAEGGLPLIKVQHHHAHVVSCMAENHLDERILGISWDGTGFGEDQTIWGGEFLLATLEDFKRVGTFKTFQLPGGEKAIKEPRRTASGVLIELFHEGWRDFKDLPTFKDFNSKECDFIYQMIKKKLNSPKTSSVGRLFDAVASILGLCQFVNFEGQAAMLLEYALGDISCEHRYDFEVIKTKEPDALGHLSEKLTIDWSRMIKGIIDDVRSDLSQGVISAKFHNTLVEMAVDLTKRIKENKVVLSGGCFQNKYLTERLIRRLREEGFHPYWHQLVPPNDGGISLGQAVCAASRIKKGMLDFRKTCIYN